MGIVHRDIKPDNLLINEHTNEVKIIDFGRAKKTEGNPTHTPNLGTIVYMAPEATTKCEEGYGYASDDWSAGVTLYRIFEGKLPFEDRWAVHTYKGTLTFRPGTPVYMQEVIQDLLIREPHLRLSAAEALRKIDRCSPSLYSTDSSLPDSRESISRNSNDTPSSRYDLSGEELKTFDS